ncbi:MAG TPA: putative toxin-antitoxin system toxin component, PIN family [Novimethylophilus sp.]|uniref:putative toxin-antitoxin system toxin component, PIN family n=1 Tax=Novimethylophilus sp. TaxID=2137426 RepID=UPI002F3FC494
MRAVIDTNILVSALLTPGGVSAQLIAAIRSQTMIPVVSQSILAEYAEILNRPKFGFSHDRITSLLEDMKGLALVMNPRPIPLQDLPDPDDAPFIAAALAAGCAIITGNSKHFPPETGVEILSPAEALMRLKAA